MTLDIYISEILTVQVYTKAVMNETHQWATDKKDTAKQYLPRSDLPPHFFHKFTLLVKPRDFDRQNHRCPTLPA